jgi:pimeloyl-ACP methyl ester carboxylesterase
LAAIAAESEVFTAAFPGASAGVEECWMELDGARMRYLRAGSGPPLVLVHGLLGYSFSWRHAMPALAGYATVYAPDMLGCGFSAQPEELDCTMRANAQRLLRFLDGLGVASCDLLGASQGGAVVMKAAALEPDRVRRLILMAPVNPWSSRGMRRAHILSNRLVAPLFLRLAPYFRFTHTFFLRRVFGDASRIRPGTLEGYSAAFSAPGSLEHKLSLLRSWKADLQELKSVLPQIASIPTLLLWGSRDTAVSLASAEHLRQQFKDCRMEVFEGVGHVPYEEVPEEFNRAVIDFLQR